MKDSEVLECAIEKLKEEGWIQGVYYREGEGYCVVGAVAACLEGRSRPPGDPSRYPVTYRARNLLRQNYFPHPASTWQDAWGRSKEEIIAALQKAVGFARAREAEEEEEEANAVRDS